MLGNLSGNLIMRSATLHSTWISPRQERRLRLCHPVSGPVSYTHLDVYTRQGYDSAIKETGRLTDERIELDEGALTALNMRYQLLMDALDERCV